MSLKRLYPLFLILIPFFCPEKVSSHAFGVLYNLPVPFWLYLYGAGAVLVASFLIIGFFLQNKDSLTFKRPNLVCQSLENPLRIFGVLTFGLVILTGLIGTNSSLDNFNMTFFWIILLLGFTYLTPLLGNFYQFVNPWQTLIPNFRGILKYPGKLGTWPGLIFYMVLIWLELFAGVTPFKLSLILVWYTVINFSGAFIFGKKIWFENFEFLGIFFKLVSKIGGIEEVKVFSTVVFILFMLSSTAYDGFYQTTVWMQFLISISIEHFQTLQKIGLIISPFVFLLFFISAIWLMKILTKINLSVGQLAKKFAMSLIPIAFVYNIAHYYTLLITQGQQIFRLISDPFGIGWNLFGTANWEPSLKVLDSGFVWHSQVFVILAGHILSVYLAHLVALKIFPKKQAVLSQIPVLLLMVIYTITGLWILSQPLK